MAHRLSWNKAIVPMGLTALLAGSTTWAEPLLQNPLPPAPFRAVIAEPIHDTEASPSPSTAPKSLSSRRAANRVIVMVEATESTELDEAPPPPLDEEPNEAAPKLMSPPPLSAPPEHSPLLPVLPRPSAATGLDFETIEEPASEANEPTLTENDPAEDTIEAADSAEVIQERYADGSVKVRRHVTMDSAGNYVNHGAWTMYNPRGEVIAEGQYRNGQRHGTWRRTHRQTDSPLFSEEPYNHFSEPFVSEATFRDGQLHGSWTITDSQSRKVSDLKFAFGQRDGKSEWFHVNGRKAQEIDYAQGTVDGKSVLYDEAGNPQSEQVYRQGRKVDSHAQRYDNGQARAEGEYLHAKIVVKKADDWWTATTAEFGLEGKAAKHGPWKAYHSNGQVQTQGQYEEDVPVGRFTWWHNNGQKALEGEYSHGKQHGVWTWWHPTGQKMSQGEYNEGAPSGVWMWWRADGTLGQKIDFSRAPSQAITPSPLDKQASVEPGSRILAFRK